jgi:hypothetical protein
MLFKFVGATDERKLVEIFDEIFHHGRMKFSAVHTFNDPFDFKYTSVYPKNRDQFEAWHEEYEPWRSETELAEAWDRLQGNVRVRDYLFTFMPRMNLLRHVYLLCLSEIVDNQLLWSHYTNCHRGFCVAIKPDILNAYRQLGDEFSAYGRVKYCNSPPKVRWFSDSPKTIIASIFMSKSSIWSYEHEFRIALCSKENKTQKLVDVDPSFMSGIVLGARAPFELRSRALALKEHRPEFSVREVVSKSECYDIRIEKVMPNALSFREML